MNRSMSELQDVSERGLKIQFGFQHVQKVPIVFCHGSPLASLGSLAVTLCPRNHATRLPWMSSECRRPWALLLVMTITAVQRESWKAVVVGNQPKRLSKRR